MSRPAIVIENLGKQYQLGMRENARETFREALTGLMSSPLKRFKQLAGNVGEEETFWALQDINFEVQPGEVVGIIGRNGAGKSTLLKVLSRITEPTTGRATIRGRVGSLLEVGTGFHQELTGRENVYLNGSILGMSKQEIDRKFDEIVDFAGVEKFLDTPVKRYSSGMKVRLGFAVAAHLEPEILIVDEVLAVGDFEFQKKCIGKMNDVAGSGRTVLFVSHNMAAVENLCTRGIVLSGGNLACDETVDQAIDQYLSLSKENTVSDLDLTNHPGRPQSFSNPVFRKLTITNVDEREINEIVLGQDAIIQILLQTRAKISSLRIIISFMGMRGEKIFDLNTRYQFPGNIELEDELLAKCMLKNVRLAPGRYQLKLVAKSELGVLDEISDMLFVDVIPSDIYGTGQVPNHSQGFLVPDASWITTTV